MASTEEVLKTICDRFDPKPKLSDIQIWCATNYGRNQSIVYGQTSKEFRNQIDESQATAILNAIELPASTEAQHTDNGNLKNALVQIYIKGELVQRQEKDGENSVNTLYREQKITQVEEGLLDPAVASSEEAGAYTRVAKQIYDALKESLDNNAWLVLKYPETTVSIYRKEDHSYQTVGGDNQEYASFDTLVADHHVIDQLAWNPNYQLLIRENEQEKDAHTLYKDQIEELNILAEAFAEPELEAKAATPESWSPPESYEIWNKDNEKLVTATSVVSPAEQAVSELPRSTDKDFLFAVINDFKAQITHLQTALQQLNHEKGIAGIGQTIQQQLQKPEVQTKIQEIQRAGSEHLENAIVRTGKTLGDIGNWIASRPDALRGKKAAEAAISIFDAGFDRTRETTYTHNEFQVEKVGRDQFVVRNTQTGSELLSFRDTRRWASDPPKITDLQIPQSGVSRGVVERLEQAQATLDQVRGSDRGEQQRNLSVAQFVNVATTHSSFQESRSTPYQVDVTESGVHIHVKGKRGLIYAEENGTVLTDQVRAKDLNRAEQAIRSDLVEQFASVARFAHNNQLDSYYTIQVGENSLHISDPERGVIYKQQGSRRVEDLQPEDFERASAFIQSVKQAQQQQPVEAERG